MAQSRRDSHALGPPSAHPPKNGSGDGKVIQPDSGAAPASKIGIYSKVFRPDIITPNPVYNTHILPEAVYSDVSSMQGSIDGDAQSVTYSVPFEDGDEMAVIQQENASYDGGVGQALYSIPLEGEEGVAIVGGDLYDTLQRGGNSYDTLAQDGPGDKQADGSNPHSYDRLLRDSGEASTEQPAYEMLPRIDKIYKNLSREEAERLLCNIGMPGSYVLRQSSASDLVLSILLTHPEGECEHHILSQDPDGWQINGRHLPAVSGADEVAAVLEALTKETFGMISVPLAESTPLYAEV